MSFAARRPPSIPAFTLLCLLAAGSLTAQQRVSPVVKFGKWAVLGASLGMNIAAARAHHDAEHAFHQLDDYCGIDPTRCAIGGDGRYLDPVSETYFQRSLSHDRAARRWLVAGEGTLLGAAALFVWELTRPKTPPRNIPFEPEVSTARGETRLGFRVAF